MRSSPLVTRAAFAGLVALTALTLTACPQKPEPEPTPEPPKIEEPGPYTPRWAFRPWISKDISDRDDTFAFVNGFKERGIPVGAVVLDSPWATNYNSFVPNPSRYGDFTDFVAQLHAQDVKVVLWTTQMLNLTSYDVEQGGDAYDGASPNFHEARRNGFFVNDGALSFWWKGQGGAIDFFNEEAMAFWRRQQQYLLEEARIDGWKLDFGEDYIEQRPIRTAKGEVTLKEYSEAYYREFWRHGRLTRGKEFVTMVRPWDESYFFPGRFYARAGEASVYWVGDNRRDWKGFNDALDHMFRSAAAGYVAVGSDIGGYLDRDDKDLLELVPADTEVFIRWTALGAMTPFMQLHGRANATPWTVPDRVEESVDAWRYWGNLHDDMVPFWYSLARTAYAGGGNVMRPVGELATWAGDWRYFVGDAFLVAPQFEAGGTRDVTLPAGRRYFDWWDGAAEPLEGGQTLQAYAGAVPLPRIPLFVVEGAIVPMQVRGSVTGLGNEGSAQHLTVLAWPGLQETKFDLYEEDETTTQLRVQRVSATEARATASRATKPLLFRLWTGAAPTEVTVHSTTAASVGSLEALTAHTGAASFYEASTRSVWVRVPANAGEVSVNVRVP